MSRRKTKRALRRVLAPLAPVLALALAAAYYFAPAPQQPSSQGEAALYVLDVGQGDSLLLESGGQWALIDAGTADSAQAVLGALEEFSVPQLSLAVATHPHADHIGGMAEVLSQVDVRHFWMPDVVHTSAVFDGMLTALEGSGAEVQAVQRGDEFALGQLTLRVLSPGPEPDGDDLNNASVVLLCEGAGVRMLLTGDAEQPVEEEIVRQGLGRIDILKAGHHGSRNASCEELLAAAQPRWAVISCGIGNSYGHPHEETLERLERSGAQVYRTDTQGRVSFVISEGEVYVHTER